MRKNASQPTPRENVQKRSNASDPGVQSETRDHGAENLLDFGLNPRQARFVEAYAENGGNGKQAAIAAGYSPLAAAGEASRQLASANVREAMRVSWEKIGLTPEAIGQSLLKNLNARKGALTMAGEEVLIADPASSVQAARVAGTFLGMAPDPRLEIDQRVSGAVVVQHLAPIAPDPFAAAIDVTPPD